MSFNRVKQGRFGTILFNVSDHYIGRSILLYGEYGFARSEAFRQIVRPGDVVVDAGANIGAVTLHLAHLVGADGQVHAFEPQRVVFQALCANMALNSIVHARCYPAALGREPGSMVVPAVDYRLPNNFGGVALSDDGAGERVAVMTVDGLDLASCRLIQADVEGMERQVIEGAGATIRRHRPYLYVREGGRQERGPLLKLIDGLGYDLYRHWSPLYNPANFHENAEDVFEGVRLPFLFGVPRDRPAEVRGYERVSPPG